jgi:hypothetical protein
VAARRSRRAARRHRHLAVAAAVVVILPILAYACVLRQAPPAVTATIPPATGAGTTR